MFIFLILTLLCTNAYAEIFVIYNPTTKEVYSLSNQDDAVLPQGFEKKNIEGNANDYYAETDAKNYKLNGNKLVLNVKRINDIEKENQDAKTVAEEKEKEFKDIDNKVRKQAYEALKAEGKVFKHINDDTFK